MPYPNSVNKFPGFPFSMGGAYGYGMSPNGHTGPSSYDNTNGETISAVEFGMKNVVRVDGGTTSDGLYQVRITNPTNGPATSVVARWYVVSTGLQVANAVDLSASVVNLSAVGIGL